MSQNAKRNLYCSPEAALLATDRNYVERPLTAQEHAAAFTSPGPVGYSDYKMSPVHKMAALNDANDVCCAACTTPPVFAYPPRVDTCSYPSCGGGGGKQAAVDGAGGRYNSHQSPLAARSCPHSASQSPLTQPRQFASIRRPMPHHQHQQQQQQQLLQRRVDSSADVTKHIITSSPSSSSCGAPPAAISREWSLSNNMADVVPRCAVRQEVATAAADDGDVNKMAAADRNNKSRDRRDPYGFEMMERGQSTVAST